MLACVAPIGVGIERWLPMAAQRIPQNLEETDTGYATRLES